MLALCHCGFRSDEKPEAEYPNRMFAKLSGGDLPRGLAPFVQRLPLTWKAVTNELQSR
jgi:hypothetical protein